MKYKVLALIVIIVAILTVNLDVIGSQEVANDYPRIDVEIHDPSPEYDIDAMRDLIDTVDREPVDNIYLLVIPKHADEEDNYLHRNPDFMEFIEQMDERERVTLVDHGLTHEGYEMNLTTEGTEQLLNYVEQIWNETELDRPDKFVPPRWYVSEEAKNVIMERYDELRTTDYIIRDDVTIESEVVPTAVSWPEQAINNFLGRHLVNYGTWDDDVFRMSVHIPDGTTDESLIFFDLLLEQMQQLEPN